MTRRFLCWPCHLQGTACCTLAGLEPINMETKLIKETKLLSTCFYGTIPHHFHSISRRFYPSDFMLSGKCELWLRQTHIEPWFCLFTSWLLLGRLLKLPESVSSSVKWGYHSQTYHELNVMHVKLTAWLTHSRCLIKVSCLFNFTFYKKHELPMKKGPNMESST